MKIPERGFFLYLRRLASIAVSLHVHIHFEKRK